MAGLSRRTASTAARKVSAVRSSATAVRLHRAVQVPVHLRESFVVEGEKIEREVRHRRLPFAHTPIVAPGGGFPTPLPGIRFKIRDKYTSVYTNMPRGRRGDVPKRSGP